MSYQKYKSKWANQYPAIQDLADKAKKRIPHVAWEYLQSGTGDEDLIKRNREAFQKITLLPRFCKSILQPSLKTTLFGQDYAAPFGIAPVGLTGLMWARTEHYLAATANRYQIPYALSTVATETPETVGPEVGNMGWFQLYPPKEKALRDSLLKRAKDAGFHTLVVTADVPMPSRRERTKRAGLRMPPQITPRMIWEGITHPAWTIATLRNGLWPNGYAWIVDRRRSWGEYELEPYYYHMPSQNYSSFSEEQKKIIDMRRDSLGLRPKNR